MFEPSPFAIVGMGFAAAAGLFLLGWVACAILSNERERLEAMELAERADANGNRLLVIARGLRNTPVRLEERGDLDRWARELEDIACAHLECINAITLDSLAANGYQGAYLGEFQPAPPAVRDGTPAEPPRRRAGEGGRRG